MKKTIEQSIHTGMVAADAKAMFPLLTVIDDQQGLAEKLLKRIAEWCIRFSPSVAIDGDDGLFLDATGCTHLWGGDEPYVKDITARFNNYGYTVRVAIADTIGAAWAVSRYGNNEFIIEPGKQSTALLDLPAAALRLDDDTVERLNKLGLRQVKDFIGMQRSALIRRFAKPEKILNHGDTKTQRNTKYDIDIITRINQALGLEEEFIQPVHPPAPYQERLPCLEPIVTATGIEIALQRLLETLCKRLQQEGKGIRTAVLKCYRVDGKIEQLRSERSVHRIMLSICSGCLN